MLLRVPPRCNPPTKLAADQQCSEISVWGGVLTRPATLASPTNAAAQKCRELRTPSPLLRNGRRLTETPTGDRVNKFTVLGVNRPKQESPVLSLNPPLWLVEGGTSFRPDETQDDESEHVQERPRPGPGCLPQPGRCPAHQLSGEEQWGHLSKQEA